MPQINANKCHVALGAICIVGYLPSPAVISRGSKDLRDDHG